MFALQSAASRVEELERRASFLKARGELLDQQLLALWTETEPFEAWLKIETLALGYADPDVLAPCVDDHEVLRLAKLVGNAEYERVIYESEIGRFLFHSSQEHVSLEDRITHTLETHSNGAHLVMFAGAALVQLFVQANWTGPPVACLSDPTKYPLPYMPRESEMEGADEAMKHLELEARATTAATGKDKSVMDLDMFPRLHAQIAEQLEINGEYIVEEALGIHFLHVGRMLLRRADEAIRNRPLTSGWWRGRVATIHQETIHSRDVAADLKIEAESGFARSWHRLTEPRVSSIGTPKRLLGLFLLERGSSAHKFRDSMMAKQMFNEALKMLELKVELSGALGKRTKFQLEDKSQLVVLASSTRTKAPEASAVLAIEPSKEGEAAGFGTVVEAGHVKIRIAEVDDETPLHERIQITPTDNTEFETQRRGHLDLVDQVAVLDLCIDVKNSYAMERLTAEEMLAYCERATENPDNWTVHGCALLLKSKLEFERWKTKERSVLQMQMLVDQQSNRLTPLQYRLKDIVEDSATPFERLLYLHALVWPPVWRLKRGLADRYKDIGVIKSALNLFQELRLWDDAVSCLVQMDKRARAETLIRERLDIKRTPSLLVTLGELTNDESLMEEAWTISGQRYARAKRILGARAYDRGDYASAKTHLSQALDVNAQFTWAWFRLGAAALRIQDWMLAKKAYARVVSLEPEDPEAWANLSACLVRLNDVDSAFRAIEEASKHGFGNSRIWDSYLTLAIRADKMDAALHATDTLIDLEGKRSGAPRIDVRAFLPITEYAIKTPTFRPRFEELVQKIKAKCQSQPDVWALVSEYFSALGRVAEKRDALVRRCRALTTDPEWINNATLTTRLVFTIASLMGSTVNCERPEQKETSMFVRNLLDKLGDWKHIQFEDAEKRDQVEEKLERIKTLLTDFQSKV